MLNSEMRNKKPSRELVFLPKCVKACLRISLIICLVGLFTASCVPGDTGIQDSYPGSVYPSNTNQWLGSLQYPWLGVVASNYYAWNGTAWVSLPTVGIPGATGATGATGSTGAAGATGAAGPNSVNSSTTSTNITGLIKGDGSYIQMASANVDYQVPLVQGARVYRNNNQSIPDSVYTSIQFNKTRWDTDSIFSISANTQLKANTAGFYLIVGCAQWATATGATRGWALLVNGSTYIAYQQLIPPTTTSSIFTGEVSSVYYLNKNDYVEFQIYQTTGASLNCVSAGSYAPEFMMQRIGN